jgi:Cu(I)/Ag(I) efflux system membrane fusion protein
MKTSDKKTLIIAAVTLTAGLLAGWLIFGGRQNKVPDKHQHINTENPEETTWTCSMHPQVRQNEPGDCPICGMDLIPLSDGQNAETDELEVVMSPVAMQLANISTAIVEKTNPVKKVRLNGKIYADERLVYSQSSHIPGRIEKLHVNFTGEYIRKGQTIATVYSPDLATAQEELLEAKKIRENQPQLYNAAREKLKNWKLSEEQIEEISGSGKIQEEFPVLADISGYVTNKAINTGDYVTTGETLYEISNLSNVWILFDLYESDIALVKKGDKIEFTVSSFPGESFEGVISYLDPVIDPKTRVAKARVVYNNARGKLKPEMFASGVVEAKPAGKSNSLVVPKSAVMWTGKRSVVYVKTGSEQGVNFIMREVNLGSALGDSYIVESGLQEGEEIAVNGTFSIDAAAQLAGKPSMMNPLGGEAMTGHDHSNIAMEVSNLQNEKPGSEPLSVSSQSKTEKFEVKGKCSMCEKRIEKAAKSVESVSAADWDLKSNILKVSFDESKTSADKIQKAIAAVGHDTPLHKAKDDVYDKLPACCKYDRTGEEKK